MASDRAKSSADDAIVAALATIIGNAAARRIKEKPQIVRRRERAQTAAAGK